MNEIYRGKVALLIEALPYIAEESDLALHGGTAINLFVREMPRLSVDIDLTYLPISDRDTALGQINEILVRIKQKIESHINGSRVEHIYRRSKLIVIRDNVDIKLEVNVVNRGVISDPINMHLCHTAQEAFEAFVEMPVVSFGQLYGGKICAALDRQHPRDLFDVKLLLAEEGFTDEIRNGFIFSLASSNHPMHELLNPNFIDQKQTMENHFAGMSTKAITYEQFEDTRRNLVKTIRTGLRDDDRTFLLSLKKLKPDWTVYDFEKFPAIQWKLHNLKNLREKDNSKYQEMVVALEKTLNN